MHGWSGKWEGARSRSLMLYKGLYTVQNNLEAWHPKTEWHHDTGKAAEVSKCKRSLGSIFTAHLPYQIAGAVVPSVPHHCPNIPWG